MMEQKLDTIVLGLGAMGSAAVYQLAKRGNKVLGIDQFSPPHHFGSSHGDTRITRQAIGEGENYTPLSLRSYDLWKDVGQETGKKLLEITGGLIISSTAKTTINHVPQFFENTIKTAKKYNIKHEILDASQIRTIFSPFKVQDNEIGYYEYNAGFLRPEECICANLFLAEKYGAEIHRNEKVNRFEEKNGTITVKTNRSSYEAENLIITAGPWIPLFFDSEYSSLFNIRRQTIFWFDAKDSLERFEQPHFPVFIWELQGEKNGIYGFPALDGQNGGVKIATEQYVTTTTADSVNREVSTEEIETMYKNYVAPNFPDLSNKCIKAVSCLYTITPDSHFVVDKHPDYSSVIIASPCSGHGFKHSAALGEALAQLVVDGKSTIDLSDFNLSRFKK